jgi:hypothetical protein
MKIIPANKVRSRYMTLLMNYLASQEEDIALISSNVANMPFVEDGEEGILEISVKVSKKDYDYAMQERTDYQAHLVEKAEKEKVKAEEKAKKIAKQNEKKEKK